jgi:hypothetical protein
MLLLCNCRLTVRSRARAAGWRQTGGPARGAAASCRAACRDTLLRRAAHRRVEALRERPPACCRHCPRRLHGWDHTRLNMTELSMKSKDEGEATRRGHTDGQGDGTCSGDHGRLYSTPQKAVLQGLPLLHQSMQTLNPNFEIPSAPRRGPGTRCRRWTAMRRRRGGGGCAAGSAAAPSAAPG